MITIYKYPINITDRQRLRIPGLVKCLSALYQTGKSGLVVYALVNTELAQSEKFVDIFVCGTGLPAKEVVDATFLGSVIDGEYVWHVFSKSYSEEKTIHDFCINCICYQTDETQRRKSGTCKIYTTRNWSGKACSDFSPKNQTNCQACGRPVLLEKAAGDD